MNLMNVDMGFEVGSIDQKGLLGTCSASVSTNYIKVGFLKATRGKNREHYHIGRYAEQIIEQKVVEHLTQELKQNLLSIKTTIKDEEIDFYTKLNRIEAEVTWERVPDLPDLNLDDFKLEQIKTTASGEYFKNVEESIISRYASLEEVEDQVKTGDYINTSWSVENEPGEEQAICIGVRPRLPEDLENKILGKIKGDVIKYSMDIPKNFKDLPLPPKYRREISSFAGKGVEIDIQILGVKRFIPPSIEDLINKGIFKSKEDLESRVNEFIKNHILNMNLTYGVNQLRDWLSQKEFEIPPSEIERYNSSMIKQLNFDSGEDSLKNLNERLDAEMNMEEALNEIRRVSESALRGDYLVQNLVGIIGLERKKLDSLLLQKLMRMDLTGRSTKEIRGILDYYRNTWTIDIILEETINWLKEKSSYQETELAWDQAEIVVKNSSDYFRYFSKYKKSVASDGKSDKKLEKANNSGEEGDHQKQTKTSRHKKK